MRNFGRLAVLAGVVSLSAGCYRATVDTGLAPSGQTVNKAWAHSFLYGLVPAATVETAAQCPNGVAKVETQHSFLNQVAYALTFGLYSPVSVSVQCAAPRTAMQAERVIVAANASQEAAAQAMQAATDAAVKTDEAVYVQFAASE